MIAHRRAFALFLFLGCAGGDSGQTDTGGGSPCVPGAQAACACPGGVEGVQVCRPDGSGYDACQCEEGSSGSGDVSGAATTTAEPTSTTAGSGTEAGTTGMVDSTTGTTGTAGTAGTGDTTGAPVACPGGPGELDLHLATLYDNPPDVADWPVTTSLTKIDFTNDGVHVEFSKLDGPDRWPDIVPPGWDGPLQYTLGMAECIDGQWHASAAIQFWYGLAASGGNVAVDDQVANNWFYDPGRWGPMAGRQPVMGETIGIFVVAGNARAVLEDTPLQSPVMERSNVVLVPMPGPRGASHSF